MISEQLALNVRLREGATFASYHQTHGEGPVACLRDIAAGRGELQACLWGAAATGKSHLLQAVCHDVYKRDAGAAYLPLQQLAADGEAVLSGLEQMDTVCVDEIDIIAGKPGWELVLFKLINALRDAGHRLVLASRQNPAHLGVSLPDLASRLLWGPVFHMGTLSDVDKLEILAARAQQRGLELPAEVGRYLLNNCPRDLAYLLALLDELDVASLAAQRRITVPFVRSVLGERLRVSR